ncbi:hypothetical protein PM8797T_20873 [Gimesia maris DSM 8797]|uniref:Secreted protein n=1 Tax=Gimesia maris TaxID=122 RepID=A0ABX5YST8_9PLAN|nr:hypothetical protein PM8797T_20873 [Gimesia maris DSM 8797]QDU16605.1 hypothetical protein CA11_44370 [Gimesia maris]QEG18645.1 hypothetical protein GmarT_45350 [Gimesia maris]|tara:strand:+ start:65629 stop:65790 length:162 start_codon:yes stop_codon:yes gene_type:complete
MNRYLFSFLLMFCLAPFQFGCGNEEPPASTGNDEDILSETSPEQEAEDMKKLQ